jgi:hypothetical protein
MIKEPTTQEPKDAEPTGTDLVAEMARYEGYFVQREPLTDEQLRDLIRISRRERAMYIGKKQ